MSAAGKKSSAIGHGSVPLGLPSERATRAEVDIALKEASVFLRAGGRWSDALRSYVDHWLDHSLRLRGA